MNVLPQSPDRNPHVVHAIDSTAKQKITAEPMGATHIFYFTVKPISCTPYRASIWGLGYYPNPPHLTTLFVSLIPVINPTT